MKRFLAFIIFCVVLFIVSVIAAAYIKAAL